MREVHQGLPFKDFVKPSTGIVEVTVCAKSGLLKTAQCPSEVTMPFLEGTAPTRYCDQHEGGGIRSPVSIEGMRQDALFMDNGALLGELKLPELRLPEWQTEQTAQAAQTRQSAAAARGTRSTRTRVPQTSGRTSPANVPRPAVVTAQPALDFRGSDYEGALPPAAPEEAPEDQGADATPLAADQGDPLGEEIGFPETGPAARPRNTRNNPIFSDEEFMLELPDYNPLLE
jgi:penicillin-binding protein 1A